MRRSRTAKQFHSVQRDMRTEPHCTCDRGLECEAGILNHDMFVLSLSSRNLAQRQWTLQPRV